MWRLRASPGHGYRPRVVCEKHIDHQTSLPQSKGHGFTHEPLSAMCGWPTLHFTTNLLPQWTYVLSDSMHWSVSQSFGPAAQGLLISVWRLSVMQTTELEREISRQKILQFTSKYHQMSQVQSLVGGVNFVKFVKHLQMEKLWLCHSLWIWASQNTSPRPRYLVSDAGTKLYSGRFPMLYISITIKFTFFKNEIYFESLISLHNSWSVTKRERTTNTTWLLPVRSITWY